MLLFFLTCMNFNILKSQLEGYVFYLSLFYEKKMFLIVTLPKFVFSLSPMNFDIFSLPLCNLFFFFKRLLKVLIYQMPLLRLPISYYFLNMFCLCLSLLF